MPHDPQDFVATVGATASSVLQADYWIPYHPQEMDKERKSADK